MDWLVLEELDDDGARLVALRLIDGERRVLFERAQDAPLRAALHPSARTVAVDVRAADSLKGRARARVALVEIERDGQRWLERSLDARWQLGGLAFSADGNRFAVEGTADGEQFPSVYVYACDLRPSSFDERLVGGVRNPHGFACARPTFVPDDGRLVYLLQTRPDGGWVPAIVDPARTGADETAPSDGTPGLHTAVLADGIDVVPEPGLLVDVEGTRVVCVTRVRGGARQRLMAVPLDGRPPRPLSKSHGRIESPALSADGQRLAYAADGRVWLGRVGGDVQPVAGEAGGEHHRGLCFDADGETLYFVTHGPHGATVDACEVSAGVPYPVAQLGDVTVFDLLPLPADPRLATALDRRNKADDKPAFVDGATSVTRLPEAGGLLGPDTAVARLDVIDRAAEGDATMAGDGTLAGDDGLGSLMTDPDGAVMDATAMHDGFDASAVPDPEDDGDATAMHAAIDLPSDPPAEVASAPEPAPRTPAALPRPVKRPAALPRPPSAVPRPAMRGAPARPQIDDDERTVLEPPAPQRTAEINTEEINTADINTVIEPPAVVGGQPSDPPVAAPLPPPLASAPPLAVPSPEADLDDSVLDLSMSSMNSMDGDSPRADFEGWMAVVPNDPEPGQRLARLERYADDPRVGIAAVAWLERQLEALATEGDSAALGLIFAIAAVAHLRLDAARPQLRAMARKAHDRLEMQRAIPEAEEHFALAALKAIDDAAVRFDAMSVYGEYQSILEKIASAMAEGGDVAERTRTLYLQLYRQRLSDALSPTSAEEVDSAAREALELAARQELARERASAERAAAEAARRAAEEEAERRQRAEAARLAAAQVGAALAQRASVADDAMWARKRAEMEGGQDEWARLRAEAEARASGAAPAGDEQDEWARLRAQAEARAGADAHAEAEAERARQQAEAETLARLQAEAEARARQEAEDRARREAEARLQAERAEAAARAEAEALARQQAADAAAPADDWARKRAEAEILSTRNLVARARAADAARPAASATPSADRFNPLATASAMAAFQAPAQPAQPARPSVREPRRVPPAPSNRPSIDAFGGGGLGSGQTDPGEAWGASAISRISAGPAPKVLPAIGFAGIMAGIALALLGVKVGAGFIIFGLIWAAGGVALLGDKRATWMVGIGAYFANAIFLVGFGLAGAPPPWIAPGGLVAGGLAAAVVGACLFLPVFRDRYRANRPRF